MLPFRLSDVARALACAAFFVLPAAARADHLWVAFNGGGLANSVSRYPLDDGVPAEEPDLHIANVTFPLTVGPDGSLYATVPTEGYGPWSIQVFGPNRTVPSRTITLQIYPETDYTSINSLAVDSNGYVYVGYTAKISGLLFSGSDLTSGIAVYSPSEAGNAAPQDTINFHNTQSGPEALVVTPRGELYAAGSTGPLQNLVYVIWHIADPSGKAKIVGKLTGQPAGGMAVSAKDGNLYVMATEPATGKSDVSVYRLEATKAARPLRRFYVHQYLGPSIALDAGYLYTQTYDPGEGLVYAYLQDDRGSPNPAFVFGLPNGNEAWQVASGP